jgi:streptogramin lyase
MSRGVSEPVDRARTSVRTRCLLSAFAAGAWAAIALVCAHGAVGAAARAFSEFPTPKVHSRPFAIAVGRDGNLWFTETVTGRIGRVTPSGRFSAFLIPTANSEPRGIAAGPDGNLWFTEGGSNKIGRITPSGTITEFPVPARSNPRGITAGPDGNLWFSEWSANKIALITPSGTVSQFPIPTEEAFPDAITAGPHGTLWFIEQIASKIVRLEPRLLTAKCAVPKLRGKTLAQAKTLLGRAHCTLGKVTEPAKHKHRLVVVAQKPAARKTLPNGAKVSLRLG